MFARIKKSGKYQYLQIVENPKRERQSCPNFPLLADCVKSYFQNTTPDLSWI
jgi:hypothetical protein